MDPSARSRCSLGRDDRVGAPSLTRNDEGGLASDEPVERRRRDRYLARGSRLRNDLSPPPGAHLGVLHRNLGLTPQAIYLPRLRRSSSNGKPILDRAVKAAERQ